MGKLASLSDLEDGLNNVIDKVKAEGYSLTSLTTTLSSSSWTQSGNIYTQTVSVSGIGALDILLVGLGSMTAANRDLAMKAKIACVSQNTNSLTFEASSEPTINVPIVIIKQGVAVS